MVGARVCRNVDRYDGGRSSIAGGRSTGVPLVSAVLGNHQGGDSHELAFIPTRHEFPGSIA